MKAAISVIITHPSTLFREALTPLLESALFHSVHAAAEFDETSQSILCSTRDALWLMGHTDAVGFQTLRHIKIKFPELTAVVLSESLKTEAILQALDAGANGFLKCDIDSAHLMKALELIASGEMVVPAQSLQIVLKRVHGTSHHELEKNSTSQGVVENTAELRYQSLSGVSKTLSVRERSILRLFVEGASNKVIANRLTITESTVKVHTKAILRKLRLKNRTQAAVWAQTHFADMYSIPVRTEPTPEFAQGGNWEFLPDKGTLFAANQEGS